jgi:hypothetical protein
MDRVSSSLTIILRIALPTMWAASVISLVVLLSWSIGGRANIFANLIVLIGLFLIIACGIAFIKLILWKLYRVEMDDKYVYVSNYFRTFKYPFQDIESIKGVSLAPERIFKIRLKSKGSFGKVIYFLASQKLWQGFIETHSHQLKNIFIPEIHPEN